jgi:hypothetical protein
MTPDIALFLIPRDMRALGYMRDMYITNFRHYVIKGGIALTIKADNEFFYLVRHAIGVTITSDFGVFDLKDSGINELQHKHQGTITIRNYTKRPVRIKFIQVIIKQK